ncbi:unnamed protein product [Tilletia controversa]|nr:unnamed protein product [Tilletia caries]CAD6950799.1 unnamed protein product [Tilletia controversa]CAD6983715.1 unnamed protein product [Tilletia controversa]CAD7067840.1 unnamed protein product [Tilletia caries]
MERMLFSTLTGSIQIDSIERQKAWYQFKGICLMGQSTSAECEVVGTIYDAGTIKLPSVVEVAGEFRSSSSLPIEQLRRLT